MRRASPTMIPPPETLVRGAPRRSSSIDPEEVARFSALAESWWHPLGQFRPLHKLNPVRIAYVRDKVAAHFGRDAKGERPLDGLALLDIGCGGGLLSEPMARLGARVTGLDASERSIAVARSHAAEGGLAIDYRTQSAEDLIAEPARFDVILNMEVVEHVADVGGFLATCLALLKPEGVMVLATLNRTPQSFALAIVGAEYVLRWLPRGTHDWRRFLRPSELAARLRVGGGRITDLVGVRYNAITGRFALGSDLSVNYMALAEKDWALVEKG